MSQPEPEHPCACYIGEDTIHSVESRSRWIEYCPLHRQAWPMYALLRSLDDYAEGITYTAADQLDMLGQVIRQARAILNEVKAPQ